MTSTNDYQSTTTQMNVSCQLDYDIGFDSTFLLNVHALQTGNQKILNEEFTITPEVEFSELKNRPDSNRIMQFRTGDITHLTISYRALVENTVTMIPYSMIRRVAEAEIPKEELTYMFPTRYCQSDKLSRFAFSEFGHITDKISQVQAICDWIYRKIEYLPGITNHLTSAEDTITERAGVCRDFAHVGIALCRALSIPARYFVGYAHQLNPPDFHACFEVYVGGHWLIFDPTRLSTPTGLACIALGHDAADASTATIFGAVDLTFMEVHCQASDNSLVDDIPDGKTAFSMAP